jgi:pSer/pThr/pTyr-binding forkhead associated (FHA) protein
LSNRIKRYQGIWVELTEGARNLYRRLGKNQFTPPTQATGKSQPNREQRKVSEHAGTRLNLSTASLLMIADDLVGGV